jgi:hypothetical protein
MENHYNFSDSEFLQKIIDCEFLASDFSHEAHLRLAWINIELYGIDQSIINIQNQLKTYVESLGAKNKYNVTLTVAAIKAVCHFRLKSVSENFKDFLTEYPQLKNNFKGLMNAHYGIDVFNSNKAKRQYLEPDLLPFD